MANDTVTSRPRCLFVQRWKRIGEAHLSYYASICNTVETNQPPQDQFNVISCVIAVLQFHSYNISVPNNFCCVTLFLYGSGFGMLLLGRTQRSIWGTSRPRYQSCPLHPSLL